MIEALVLYVVEDYYYWIILTTLKVIGIVLFLGFAFMVLRRFKIVVR